MGGRCGPGEEAGRQAGRGRAPRSAAGLGGARHNTAIRSPIAASRAGHGGELPAVPAAYHAAFAPLVNGMSEFEGEQAHSVEHMGLITTPL